MWRFGSIGRPDTRHLLPGVKRLDANGTIVSCGHPVTAGAKQMIHGALGRENALDRAGGPEPTPRSLSLSSRRVGLASFMVVKPIESADLFKLTVPSAQPAVPDSCLPRAEFLSVSLLFFRSLTILSNEPPEDHPRVASAG